ncbi:DMT family transporter [Cytobacillus kochii]
MKRILPFIMIAAGASLWGIIGLFVKGLASAGFTSMEIVAIRAIFAVLFLLLIGFIHYRQEMKLHAVGDVRYFLGTGICSIVLFNFCYFTTMSEMSISMAVIFLYTAPAFVTILSFMFLKEKMTINKIIAVIMTMAGCILIAGLALGESQITILGIITGLGSGIGYALYTIFGKFALNRYSPFAVTFFTFVIAAVVLIPITSLWEKSTLFMQTDVMLLSVGLGLIPTVLAYILYTKGLEKTEGSTAAVISTVEPVVATIMGVLLFNESLVWLQVVGALFIVGSVVVVNLPQKKRKRYTSDEITQ